MQVIIQQLRSTGYIGCFGTLLRQSHPKDTHFQDRSIYSPQLLRVLVTSGSHTAECPSRSGPQKRELPYPKVFPGGSLYLVTGQCRALKTLPVGPNWGLLL